jgi:hypothetical protein
MQEWKTVENTHKNGAKEFLGYESRRRHPGACGPPPPHFVADTPLTFFFFICTLSSTWQGPTPSPRLRPHSPSLQDSPRPTTHRLLPFGALSRRHPSHPLPTPFPPSHPPFFGGKEAALAPRSLPLPPLSPPSPPRSGQWVGSFSTTFALADPDVADCEWARRAMGGGNGWGGRRRRRRRAPSLTTPTADAGRASSAATGPSSVHPHSPPPRTTRTHPLPHTHFTSSL